MMEGDRSWNKFRKTTVLTHRLYNNIFTFRYCNPAIRPREMMKRDRSWNKSDSYRIRKTSVFTHRHWDNTFRTLAFYALLSGLGDDGRRSSWKPPPQTFKTHPNQGSAHLPILHRYLCCRNQVFESLIQHQIQAFQLCLFVVFLR